MNRKQQEQAIAAVMQGATLDGAYVGLTSEDTRRCALGSLAEAAGIPLPGPTDVENTLSITHPNNVGLAASLADAYGLGVEDLDIIQRINDYYSDDVEVRRKNIVKYLKSLRVEE